MSEILPFCLANAIEIYQVHRVQDTERAAVRRRLGRGGISIALAARTNV
jgi:hypothetical protein